MKKKTAYEKKIGKEVGLPPSEETVVKWVRKDMESAHYLLGIILQRYPHIITEMGKDVYRTTMEKENGAAIDHKPQPAAAAETGLD